MPDYDSALHNQINNVHRMVVDLDRSLTVVGSQVAVVGQEQRETRSELGMLRNEFLTFVRQAELTANIQLSETKIGVLEGRLDNEFGKHKEVRATALGILGAFDVGLVSEDVIRTVSEQLMMQTPRYWLAPVLVALSAWAADDQHLCAHAVEVAFSRSPERTSLFMALVLRRQGRPASAVRWLRHYLNAQDPAALGREFAVILECVAQGAFGPAAVELIQDCLDRWQEQLLSDESIRATQVQRWRREIEKYIRGTSTQQFPSLAQISPQWPVLDRALSCAQAHEPLVATYQAMLAEEVTPSNRLEDAVDDILDRLVREYDPEELPLRRDLAYHNTVVEQQGDIAAADHALRTRAAALESTLDYLSVQTQSALTPDDIGVSRSTQRIAVAACHEWLAQAHAGFTMDYRLALPQSVEVVFGSLHNAAAQAFRLPPWTGSFVRPVAELEAALAAHWDRSAQPYINGFTAGWKNKIILASVLAATAFVVLSLCLGPVGILVGMVGCGVAGIVLYTQWQAALKRQQNARAFVERAKADSIRQLRAANAELVDWTALFREADSGETRVRTLVEDLSTAGQVHSRYERRTVDRA